MPESPRQTLFMLNCYFYAHGNSKSAYKRMLFHIPEIGDEIDLPEVSGKVVRRLWTRSKKNTSNTDFIIKIYVTECL